MRKYNLIVTDDSPLINNLICEEVVRLGHNPIPFSDGQEVINYITNDGQLGVPRIQDYCSDFM